MGSVSRLDKVCNARWGPFYAGHAYNRLNKRVTTK